MTDRLVVRVVAGGLALTLLGSILSATLLAMADKPIPDLINNLAIASIGALASLLANTRSTQDPPAPVTVVNEDTDPVPTTAAKTTKPK